MVLCNHSFKTNPNTVTNLSKLYQLTFAQCVRLLYTHFLGIFFGHHKGDIQENVISNMMRRTSPLNLSGMNEIGTVENVSIYRPLLPHTKEDIFDFAHTFGVPYFKDTTPKWSVRGKLR